MLTLFLGDGEADAYLRDLSVRLLNLGDLRPSVWCPIGPSGGNLAERLLTVETKLAENTKIVPVSFDRDTKAASFEVDSADDLAGKHVLVLDSSVHSGGTMLAVVHSLQAYAPASTLSYSLVLKRSSDFVPTYWGLTIDDHDRAYFMLDKLPNNRLDYRATTARAHLRRLRESDLGNLPNIKSGEVDSLDRITWADRWYDMRNSENERRTYILESGATPIGYMTYAISTKTRGMKVEEVVVAADQKSRGFGGILMRWAETMARQSSCGHLELWAIEAKIPFYQRLKYGFVGTEEMVLDGECYRLMKKPVLYHLKLADA